MQPNYLDDEQAKNLAVFNFNTKNKAQIYVKVEPTYLEKQSHIGSYIFSYKVYIENIGDITSQIIARNWIITDGQGEVREVKGLTIVGEQPILQPKQKHEYTSTVTIPTKVGTMKGTYLCITENGDLFAAPIAEFTLALPMVLH